MNQLLRRFASIVETVAAICLAVVTILIFVSALGRYLFSAPIPDAFDISRLLLGLAIAWGYAVLGYRGGHICVDLLVEALPERPRRALEVIAQAILLIFTFALAWKLFDRVISAYNSTEATSDLRFPVWPFIGGIWLGVAAAVLTTLAGLILMISGGPLQRNDPEDDVYE
ncbi:TRAP transporter small permease [Paracoccus aurantiacus]|uniref:TRAP transporter small permease protein n=1 Tax=Paracoccus aurantiacus TaxID=2599412 RepID=A0A5C6RTU9_9RHOB|nr:TRAP transporter small permease [Paracoccus aurantiacus]